MGIVGGGSFFVNEENMRFREPAKMDPKLKENLGIFDDEEAGVSPMVLSFDSEGKSSHYMFPVDKEFKDLSKEKNYETFPSFVLHHMFLFLKPSDLINVFSTCKYFHFAGSSNLFWKKYYVHFFDLKEEHESEMMKNLNYKKQFFKRFSDCRCANLFYLNRQNPTFTTDERLMYVNEMNPHRGGAGGGYAICGPPGVGKRSLLIRLWKDVFGEESHEKYGDKKILGNLHFNYVDRRKSNSYTGPFRRIRILSEPKISETGFGYDSLEKTSSFLFCFVAGDRESFKEVEKFIKLFSSKMKNEVPKKQRRRGMLVGMKSDGDIELVGGKKKKKGYRRVTDQMIKKLIKKYLLKGYVECSAKENTSCYLPFGVLVQKISWRMKYVCV